MVSSKSGSESCGNRSRFAFLFRCGADRAGWVHLPETKALPLASVITPNLSEASAIAGMNISGLEGMRTAAAIIHRENMKLGGGLRKEMAVIVKGGTWRVMRLTSFSTETNIIRLRPTASKELARAEPAAGSHLR